MRRGAQDLERTVGLLPVGAEALVVLSRWTDPAADTKIVRVPLTAVPA